MVDKCQATPYTQHVIKSFKHRGLKALYDGERSHRLNPVHVPKLRRILAVLDQSTEWQGMDIPGFRLHTLVWAVEGALRCVHIGELACNFQI